MVLLVSNVLQKMLKLEMSKGSACHAKLTQEVNKEAQFVDQTSVISDQDLQQLVNVYNARTTPEETVVKSLELSSIASQTDAQETKSSKKMEHAAFATTTTELTLTTLSVSCQNASTEMEDRS